MSRIAVVTDSAADLPSSLARDAGVAVVPLTVRFGDLAFVDGVDLSPEEFWSRASEGEHPTTASPSPGEMAAAYESAAASGARGVVSVHVSRALSRTVETAHLAARGSPVPVKVIDSGAVSLGQGLVALEAAAAAANDEPLEAVSSRARRTAERLRVFAMLDTVEFLRRGGRVGRAKAAMSDLLRIRPILTLTGGEPALVARARTRTAGIEELTQRALGATSACAVFHSGSPEAGSVATAIGRACATEPLVAPVGAVTGAHLGPRALGVAVVPSLD